MKGKMTQSQWLIRQMAEGDVVLDHSVICRLAEQLGLTLSEAGGFCVAVRYTQLSDALEDAGKVLALQNACGAACRQEKGKLHCYIGSHLHVVLVATEPRLRESNTLEKLYRTISQHSPAPIQMGVGSVCRDLEKLSYSRVEAYEALQSLAQTGTLAYVEDIYATRSLTTLKHTREKRQIMELFKSGDVKRLELCVLQLVENVRAETPVRAGQPYPTSIRRTVVELLLEILHISADMGVDVETLLDHQDPYTKIFEMGDTPSILAWFFETVEMLAAYVRDQRSKADSGMLTLAKKTIDAYLCDPELSLSLVSDALEITPAYFSAFFIRQMGIGFNEYITGLRVERAKQLLADTNKKINAVAAQCGFRSASYFTVVFRKVTGMSPGDYRNRKINNES